jgi:thymidine kinase
MDLLTNQDTQSILECDVFLINEGQFFKDLYEAVLELLKNKKTIYVSGLDGDYKKDKIGNILDLIPHSDNVIKLNSLCGVCRNGTKAIFSKRISNEIEQILVGVDNYVPVCRKCYDN